MTTMQGRLLGAGRVDAVLAAAEVERLVAEGLRSFDLRGKRVLCVIPDATRTAPMPLLFRIITEHLSATVASLSWLIALGTHQPMSQAAICGHLGISEDDPVLESTSVLNHAWADAGTFVTLGEISASEVEELSGGRLHDSVPVRINRHLLDQDVVIVVGPVFPHEVVGFSGGNKYFFPGLSGPELIDVSHWLGALITASEMIGAPGITPVRRLIDRAAEMIPVERRCIAVVVRPGDGALHGVYLGACEDTWAEAAALSANVHIEYVDRAFETVVSAVPSMYADLWTAAKGVYKLEPIVADGGELILYAPHVRTFSETHGDAIEQVGYHCRDYFLAGELPAGVPLGVLAHSTHVRGRGTYDRASGQEHCRIKVTLATGIPREVCERANLAWRDPASIELPAWEGRSDTLVVPRAGEVLHRLTQPDG